MVLGVATGLLGLGLALPTGLAFGYGYGYGVRQGYSAFKPPSKTANDLKLSPDPVQASMGMGLQTAEERTNTKTPLPLSTGPSLQQQAPALLGPKPTTGQSSYNPRDYYHAKDGRIVKKSEIKTRQQLKDFHAGVYPYNKRHKQRSSYHTRR